MGPRTQWVNLPEASSSVHDPNRFKGEGVEGGEFMGRDVVVVAEFDRKEAFTLCHLRVIPDGGNATYLPEEAALKADSSKLGYIDPDGKATFWFRCSAAGGDRFQLKVVDEKGTEKDLEEIETARKLYYQVIKMKGPSGAGELGLPRYDFLHQEMLGGKRAIHLVPIPSKGTIAHSYCFTEDGDEYERLFALAKNQYSEAKDPYCFALVWADCLVRGPSTLELTSEEVSWKTGTLTIPLEKGGKYYQLWNFVDKSPTAVPWKMRLDFVHGPFLWRTNFPIPDGDVTVYPQHLVISTRHFPENVTGRVRLKVKVATTFFGGWSFTEENLIVIATRTRGDEAVPEAELRAVVVHEAGHKIGLVPNGHTGGLKAQSTLDRQYDPASNKSHCTDQHCTMWWTTKFVQEHYCAACATSARKINLSAPSLPGFRRFY